MADYSLKEIEAFGNPAPFSEELMQELLRKKEEETSAWLSATPTWKQEAAPTIECGDRLLRRETSD